MESVSFKGGQVRNNLIISIFQVNEEREVKELTTHGHRNTIFCLLSIAN